MNFLQRKQRPHCGVTSGHYLKKSLENRLILKQRLFFLRIHEGTPIKSHIVEFFSIINDLDKIEVKIKDKDQTLLLLFTFFI